MLKCRATFNLKFMDPLSQFAVLRNRDISKNEMNLHHNLFKKTQ